MRRQTAVESLPRLNIGLVLPIRAAQRREYARVVPRAGERLDHDDLKAASRVVGRSRVWTALRVFHGEASRCSSGVAR